LSSSTTRLSLPAKKKKGKEKHLQLESRRNDLPYPKEGDGENLEREMNSPSLAYIKGREDSKCFSSAGLGIKKNLRDVKRPANELQRVRSRNLKKGGLIKKK